MATVNLQRHHVYFTLKRWSFPRRFNVECTCCVSRVCKSLFGVVLFCSIIMRNVVIVEYLYFWNNTSYWILQGIGIASFTSDSFHLIDAWLFSSFYEIIIAHELSGQNKLWFRRGDKTSHDFLISIMSLVYGTGYYLGWKSSFHFFLTFSGGRGKFFQKNRNSWKLWFFFNNSP